MRKELRFGFTLMAIILVVVALYTPWGAMTNAHMGLLMLALVVVTIMLGFPTAFTLMGMGILFSWYAYYTSDPDLAVAQTLDLMVQRTYGVMTNDVLIAIPLFMFMGYLVERANLIRQLFNSIHLAMARIPGSLAVATLLTCTVFATATGIVGAVVTLMGLLAMPAMLRHGYDIRLTAGCITAGGCLGILIPPSILLIVYGATAGVSVVQLYAGAFFPGLMLAALYIGYVIILAKLRPDLAPPLPMDEREVPLPDWIQKIAHGISPKALLGLLGAVRGGQGAGYDRSRVLRQLMIVLLPALVLFATLGLLYRGLTAPAEVQETAGLIEMGQELSPDMASSAPQETLQIAGGVQEPPMELGVQEPPMALGVQEPPLEPLAQALPASALPAPVSPAQVSPASQSSVETTAPPAERALAPSWYWVVLGVGGLALIVFYRYFTFARVELFKMLLGSFFPLSVLILTVLGSIVFGLATPTEAAAVGALGGAMLAVIYKRLSVNVLKESVFLTAKTSAMVCWLFVGSSIFSAAFALLGGQGLVEKWVLSMDLTPVQFLLLSQAIIFILGWPLEWTEIIVIFMPIFIPLLAHFNIDPLFFGLLVAMNLQTAFLSPPVAMAAFYLKGVSPPHVTLNQIFAGMMPFMAIQVLGMALLYMWPQIGLWLPTVLYK